MTEPKTLARIMPRRATALARAPSLLAGETIELETAFSDASLEMDETGEKFRVGLALQTQIAEHEEDLDSAATDIAALEAGLATAQADIIAAQADADAAGAAATAALAAATAAQADATTALANAASALAQANLALAAAIASPQSELWAKPATPGAFDVEFDSATLPAAFTLFNIQGTTATAVTPISGIDLWSQPAAGACRIEAHKAPRRSWLLCQPRAENVRWFYAQKITLSGTLGWVFRTRLSTYLKQGGGSNNASTMRFTLGKDDGTGNKPQLVAAGGGVQDGFTFGWETDVNTLNIDLNVVKAGTNTAVYSGLDKDDINSPVDYELCAVLRSGSLQNTWEFVVRSPNTSWQVAVIDSSQIGPKQGDTIWIGWEFVGLDDVPIGSGRSPVLPTDYMRVEATNANFLP